MRTSLLLPAILLALGAGGQAHAYMSPEQLFGADKVPQMQAEQHAAASSVATAEASTGTQSVAASSSVSSIETNAEIGGDVQLDVPPHEYGTLMSSSMSAQTVVSSAASVSSVAAQMPISQSSSDTMAGVPAPVSETSSSSLALMIGVAVAIIAGIAGGVVVALKMMKKA